VDPAFLRDQMMRAAISIQRNAAAMGAKVVTLTSAKPSGGTTTLCLRIAEEITRMGGRPLVIEANAFKPDARYKGGPGLAALLQGDADAPDLSWRHTVPAGDMAGARHLPNLKELRPLLDRIGAGYDLILLDAPPLLLSADTEFLARMADLTILIVEAESLTAGELRRAARSLERIQPPAVGAVVNRVPIYSAGGYYRAVVDEFKTGERRGPSQLLSPWLWK
jgi:succinoglycan biosynthesis transport protein ExoP